MRISDWSSDVCSSDLFNLASEAKHCVADDRSGALYIAEEAVGIWRFDADPEAEIAPTLVDAARLGRISKEVGGVALYDGGPGADWRSEEHTSELQSLMRISYAVYCLQKKTTEPPRTQASTK